MPALPSRFSAIAHAPERRFGLAVAIAVHLALLYCWSMSRPIAPPAGDDAANPVAWLRFAAAAPKTAPPPLTNLPRLPALRSPARAVPDAAPVIAPTSTPPAALPIPATPSVDPFAAPAPTAAATGRSADDILQQARHDIGKIDRDLRKEFRGPPIPARADTAQTRLQRGFDAAALAVPNHWYEAPKVVEMMDEGGYGRKIYKVISPAGTYCIYFESNHAPDGIDVFQHGPNSKTATCPREK
jgi:hypothetical protein